MTLHKDLLKNVEWKDLLILKPKDILLELSLSLPWLMLSFYFAYKNNYLFALPCSFMFFLTGLRQVHNAFHFALGISRPFTHKFMYMLSLLMLGSMHAIQINHLRHHQHCMTEEDIEAKSAKMRWWQAILFGPFFPILLHKKALEVATPSQKKWITLELIGNIVILTIVFTVLDISFIKYHFITMLIGQCMTAFFAVWTVHHDTEDHVYMARTLRHPIKRLITYNMFLHVEHHLFPAVPTCKLHILSKRLDQYSPNVEIRKAF